MCVGWGIGRRCGVVAMVWHRVLHGNVMLLGRSVLLHHVIVHHGHVLLHHHVVVGHHGGGGGGLGGGNVAGMVPHVFDVGVVRVMESVVLSHSKSKAGQQNDHSLELEIKVGNN